MNFIQGVLGFFSPKTKASKEPKKRSFEIEGWDLKRDLLPGDIVLYRFGGKKDFAGGIISHMTSSPYSHCEVHIENGHDISAGSAGVGFEDLFALNIKNKKTYTVDVLRLKDGLSRERRITILEKCFKTLLLPYDYANLAGFHFFSKKAAIKRSGNEAYICSEHVAWSYKNAGVDLIADRPEAIEAPADIGHSDVLDYIGTYRKGTRIDKDLRNEFIDEEQGVLSKLVAKFMNLFSMKDEFYEGISINKEMLKGTK